MLIKERKKFGSIAFDVGNILVMLILAVLFLYPMWHVMMASFSDPAKLMLHTGVLLKPEGFSLEGYKSAFSNRTLLLGYANTLFYVVVGTTLNILLTSIGAYVLSRRRFPLKKIMTILIVFTMYFGGGMIPDFILVRSLGLYDSRLALILPNAIITWNLIVMTTSFREISPSIEESAMIDGANNFTILFRIILPVAKAIIAVMIIFYAVGHWNSWFNAMVYIRDSSKYPLQIFLRQVLISTNSSISNMSTGSSANYIDGDYSKQEVIKYATIIVTTVPILCVYPIGQKYFVKGVMMGSLKE